MPTAGILAKTKKTVAVAGTWKVETGKAGKMNKSAFPLSKRSSVRLGRGWHWRVDTLTGGGETFRLLTAFQPDKEEYRAILGLVGPGELLTIIGELEYHGTHPGWHCHAVCEDVTSIVPGCVHHEARGCVRLPGGDRHHRDMEFDVTESNALGKAFEFFGVTGTPAGSMI